MPTVVLRIFMQIPALHELGSVNQVTAPPSLGLCVCRPRTVRQEQGPSPLHSLGLGGG